MNKLPNATIAAYTLHVHVQSRLIRKRKPCALRSLGMEKLYFFKFFNIFNTHGGMGGSRETFFEKRIFWFKFNFNLKNHF